MCMARDVAVVMINKSIDLAEEKNDDRYFMDFVKLHKLLYLGQCFILSRYGMRLFEDDISAHRCGPYVDGIGFIPAEYGFEALKKKIAKSKSGMPFLPISYSRAETVDFILGKYGTNTTDEVVLITKETKAYAAYKGMYDRHLIIPPDEMAESGKQLFGD